MNMFRTPTPACACCSCKAVLLACIRAGAVRRWSRGAVRSSRLVPASDVMAVDRDFAQRALETGIRFAYDRYLAPDAVVFRPLPVPAREWFATHEPATGRLEWTPAVAATACDSEPGCHARHPEMTRRRQQRRRIRASTSRHGDAAKMATGRSCWTNRSACPRCLQPRYPQEPTATGRRRRSRNCSRPSAS